MKDLPIPADWFHRELDVWSVVRVLSDDYYTTAWSRFVEWCRRESLTAFPAAPKVVLAYLRYLQDAQGGDAPHAYEVIGAVHNAYI